MLDTPATTPLLRSLGNFRDLGGLPTLQGGRTRTNRLYRSPRLSGLSETDLRFLDACGIAAIVDFRGQDEAQSAPIAVSPSLLQRRVGLAIEPQAGRRIREAELVGEVGFETVRAIMIDGYRAYVAEHAPIYAQFVRLVAEADGPVVFHCSAGKDRTGFGAALLLAAAGVTPEAIAGDFLRSNRDWQPPEDLGGKVPERYRKALLGVDIAYLDAAFEVLDHQHGGAVRFAREALGGRAAFERFQHKLTES